MSANARPLVIASNRGPVSYDIDDEGQIRQTRGGGGLVTALTGVLSNTGGLWISAAMSEGDRQAAASSPGGRLEVLEEDAKYNLRYLTLPPEEFDRAYNVISNRLLWFLYHYLFDTPRTPRFTAALAQAWQDYRTVNREFALALADESGEGDPQPAYLVQDYHLALVPRMLRDRCQDAPIVHFSHTPFAGPDYFFILPREMGRAVLEGMLGADVLGFQAEAWAENFLLCCRKLEDAQVDLRRRRVVLDGHETMVRVYPISIDVPGLRDQARTDEVKAIRRELKRWLGNRKLVLRVDRSELSKNILRGFLAVETFLKTYPRWQGEVSFLALLNPSRRAIPEYRTYTRDCLRIAERINHELGRDGWSPITVTIRDDVPRALAAYGLYDVLMVNPVFDGMNLVAMEGPTVNRKDGALILSRNTGAFSLLGEHAISVNPFEVQQTAEVLNTALTMPQEERAARAKALRRVIGANTPERWVGRQLEDLERAVAARRG